jgi:hypothetical protein
LFDGMTGTFVVSSGKGLASAGLVGCWAGFGLVGAGGFWAGDVWAGARPWSAQQLNPSTTMKKLRLNPNFPSSFPFFLLQFTAADLDGSPGRCGLLVADGGTTHDRGREGNDELQSREMAYSPSKPW